MENYPDPDPHGPPQPNPGQAPLEVNTEELHTRPEVDYGSEPSQPLNPEPIPPETVPHPPEREVPHEPDIEPGRGI